MLRRHRLGCARTRARLASVLRRSRPDEAARLEKDAVFLAKSLAAGGVLAEVHSAVATAS
jgi:hypothetical protein